MPHTASPITRAQATTCHRRVVLKTSHRAAIDATTAMPSEIATMTRS